MRTSSARRLDRVSRSMVTLVFILVCTSAFTYLPQMLEMFTRGRLGKSPRLGDIGYFLFRFPREILVFVVLVSLVHLFIVARQRLGVTPATVRVCAAVGVWILACFVYSVTVKGVPVLISLLGLRIFQFVPLLAAGYVVAQSESRRSLMKFSGLLRWYVLVIIVVGVIQTAFGPGKRTIFGARSFGPFTNMNAYGSTLVVCGLWFLLARLAHERVDGTKRYGWWLVACTALTLTTGSRTAITLSIVVTAMSLYPLLGRKLKIAGAAVVLSAVCVLPFVLGSPAITGRIVERSNSNRLKLANSVVDSFESPADVVFGSGLGLFSKSAVVLFGKGSVTGQVGNPHSTYLEVVGGFGVVGLLGFVGFFAWTAIRGPRPEGVMFALVVGLLGVTQNLSGLFPVDALILFLWGQVLGIGRSEGLEIAGSGKADGPGGAEGPDRLAA